MSGWINGKYEPAAATVFTIERSLGLDPGSLSRPLGYLPVEPTTRPASVEAAIAQSTNLDDDAKAALATLYRVLARRSTQAVAPASSRRQVTRAKGDGVATAGARPVASGR